MTERNKQKPNMRELTRLASEGVPAAVDTLLAIVGNAQAKDSDRIAASKAIMIAAANAQDAADKPMEEMTPEELATYRRHLEARIAALDTKAGGDVFG